MYDKDELRQYWSQAVSPLFNVFWALGIKPMHITLLGSVFIVGGCYQIITDHYWWAALLFLMAGACDATDGAYARATGQVTDFGGFLDSMTDRYNEFLIVGTILYVFRDQPLFYYVSFVMFLGISSMSYSRALFARYGYPCPGNPFEYLERGVLLLVCLMLGHLELWLAMVTVGTHLYVLQRVLRFYQLSRGAEDNQSEK